MDQITTNSKTIVLTRRSVVAVLILSLVLGTLSILSTLTMYRVASNAWVERDVLLSENKQLIKLAADNDGNARAATALNAGLVPACAQSLSKQGADILQALDMVKSDMDRDFQGKKNLKMESGD